MKMEKNEEYFNRGMDMKRLFLYFQKKAWLLLALVVLGAVLSGVVYQVVRSLKMPVEYETVSKLYISFASDENGEVYQHYNGYTWNDLLDTDMILDLIMEQLPGYEKKEVQEATTAEILSDIRLLTTTVRGENEKFTREVQTAVENGLIEFARQSEEIELIKVIRSEPPRRVYWDDRTTSACVAGAVSVGVIALLVIGFCYALNDAVYVQADVEARYPYPALGILTRNQKGLQPYARELRANLRYLAGEKRTLAVVDIANHGDVRGHELERLLNSEEMNMFGSQALPKEEKGWYVFGEETEDQKEKEWEILAFNENVLGEEECRKIRDCGGVLVLIPFGEDAGRITSRILTLLKNQDCRILGVIIAQADEEYLNRYYA